MNVVSLSFELENIVSIDAVLEISSLHVKKVLNFPMGERWLAKFNPLDHLIPSHQLEVMMFVLVDRFPLSGVSRPSSATDFN